MQSVISYLSNKDIDILHFINKTFRCNFLDIFMNFVTHLGSLPTVILIMAVLINSENEMLVMAGQKLAMVLLISQVGVHFFKWLVNRPRPFCVWDDVIATHPPTSKRSFPSGHTCAAFAIALTLGGIFHTWIAVLIPVAILIGISRIYLGAHYPSDVLVGMMLALTSWILLY